VTGRRAQTHADNRHRIFTVARAIVDAEGAPAVTVRRVATEIGYTAPIVYQHYADKAALLDAVMVDAYDRLAAAMRNARGDDPSQGPRAILHAYLDFAAANHRVFLFMHGMGGVDIPPARRLEAAHDVVAVTVDTLLRWRTAQPHPHAVDVAAQAEVLWAVATGLALTAFAQPDGFDRVHALAALALEPLLTAWGDERDDR